MISIIIPIYNQAENFPSTLESILNQDIEEQDLEVIIVNDGSTDSTEKVIEQHVEKFKENDITLKVFSFSKNQGAPAARNKGFQESEGEYVLFCDADASLKPHALKKMFSTLQQVPDASYVYSSFKWGKKEFRPGHFDREKLKQQPYIHTMSLIRREDFPEEGWDESLARFQDWDLWLTMLEQDKIGYWIDEILFTVQTGGSISSWRPSFFYKIFPFLPSVKKYKKAVNKVKKKHGLPLSQ